ncbi:14610_t:CDS:2 [Funneliformis geosporum]|nr:14610_t:CDS:2 [Funneliformis geosporum]
MQRLTGTVEHDGTNKDDALQDKIIYLFRIHLEPPIESLMITLEKSISNGLTELIFLQKYLRYLEHVKYFDVD